jgi:ABC-2 type transport system ATP-binding protein
LGKLFFVSVITAKELSYRVASRGILERLTFEIKPQTFTVVVGENGAGKTTLLKLLMGFSKPSEGSLHVLGKAPHEDPYQDRLNIAYIAERLSPPIDWSVREFLDFNRYFYPEYSLEREKELLKLFRLSQDARIGSLSTGESRRIQVVASLSYSPKLVIIDEITAVLDIVGRSKFMGILRDMREHGATILMATNIIDDVDSYASHLLLLHDGKLVLHTTREEVLKTRKQNSLTESIASLIEEGVQS